MLLFKLKKKEKRNAEQSQNHERETYIQRKQGDYDCDVYDINNKFIKFISSNKSIKRKECFSFIKFSHEEVLST